MKIAQELKNTFKTLFQKRKGVALLLVTVMISIMLPLVFDMNYDSKVEFDLAMNYKKKAEARVLAQSGIAFAVIVFDLQSQVEGAMKSFGAGSGLPAFEIWDIIPIDTSLLRGFLSAGPFADLEDIGKESEKGTGETEENQPVGIMEDEGDPFFSFKGDFKLEFENEDSKINLNLIDSGRVEDFITQIKGIIEPDVYDFIFLENTDRAEYVTREELIVNIVDWIDRNSEKHDNTGDEGSLYDKTNPKYRVKNAPMDTIEELRMVYGVNDVIYKLLYPYVTLYSNGKINIAKANAGMLESIIRTYADREQVGTLLDNPERIRELMGKVLAKRAKDGFNTANDFISFLTEEGVALNRSVANYIDTKGSIYRIKAIGIVDEVESIIEVVVDRQGNMKFYKER